MPLYIDNLLVAFCILPIPVLIFPFLLVLLPGICDTLMKVIGQQPNEYFGTFVVQFSSGSIIVQGQLHCWLVSQILIGLVTLMIRRSTAGYVFNRGSGTITWACKKQSALALSSAEAEYRATIQASKEAMWLQQILSEFGFEQQHPTTLWCDNQSAIQLCKDSVQHQHRKHIELHMHFIRKLINDHVLEVLYFPTEDQVANIFTKTLIEMKFTKLQPMVGV